MDIGIKEVEFWDMTIGEVNRAIESKNRIVKIEAQEKANYDYIQAILIVKGISICLGDKKPFPSIYEAYPNVFDNIIQEQEEERQKKQDELSALRFKQFAQSYNNKFKNKEVPKKINE